MLHRPKPLTKQEATDLQQKCREGFPNIFNWFDEIKANIDASTIKIPKKENSLSYK